MPQGPPQHAPKGFIGLPGKNVKPPRPKRSESSDGLIAAQSSRLRDNSPLGITLDTSLDNRHEASPELESAGPHRRRRRSSMLVIPLFDSGRGPAVSRRKDAPAPLTFGDGLSPGDKYISIAMSNPNTPEFLRLNSKHEKNRPTARVHDPATASLTPTIVIVTPTQGHSPPSPRRTKTEPPRFPRSSSIYTRNTRMFSPLVRGFQTPAMDDSIPPVPRLHSGYALSKFTPFSPALTTPRTATTVFEDESDFDLASRWLSPLLSARSGSRASLETALPTPLRNNGWWNVLSPIIPQGLTRANTAPARIHHALAEQDDPEAALIKDTAPMSATLPRGINDDDDDKTAPSSPHIQRQATQRSIPTTGEAAEYYDQTKNFDPAARAEPQDSPMTEEHMRSIDAPLDPPQNNKDCNVLASPDPHPIAADLRDTAIVPGPVSTEADALPVTAIVSPLELKVPTERGNMQEAQIPTHQLGSAFSTPKRDAKVRACDSFVSPDSSVSPGVVEDAQLTHFHNPSEVHDESFRAPTKASQVLADEGPERLSKYYKGFSGDFTSHEIALSGCELSRDDDHLHQQSDTPPRMAPSCFETFPTQRNAEDYSAAPAIHQEMPFANRNADANDFTGHEKAIAMGMDKPAQYRMYGNDYENEKNAKYSNMSVGGSQRRRRAVKAISDSAMSRKGRMILGASTAVLLVVFILALVLPMTLTRTHQDMPVGTEWLNLTGYPPIPTGISTIAQPNTQAESSCSATTDAWSCSLPQEEQYLIPSQPSSIPNFRFEVRFVGSSQQLANSSTSQITKRFSSSTRKAFSASLKARDIFEDLVKTADPSPPSLSDRQFLGNTTDHTEPFEGESTPFVISFLPLTQVNTTLNGTTGNETLARRDASSSTSPSAPTQTPSIPKGDTTTNGSAAPATLYPLAVAQPLYLFNRGQATEHYGFYTYFDRSIFLRLANSTAGIDSANVPVNLTSSSLNSPGGAPRQQATDICTWSQTRFLVQIWTRPSADQQVTSSLPPGSGNSTASATDFNKPGSFPWPVTITLDRHGGDGDDKGVYCYSLDGQQKIIKDSQFLLSEDRSANGTLINPAPGPFETMPDVGQKGNWGGIDGGSGGCQCSWTNF